MSHKKTASPPKKLRSSAKKEPSFPSNFAFFVPPANISEKVRYHKRQTLPCRIRERLDFCQEIQYAPITVKSRNPPGRFPPCEDFPFPSITRLQEIKTDHASHQTDTHRHCSLLPSCLFFCNLVLEPAADTGRTAKKSNDTTS